MSATPTAPKETVVSQATDAEVSPFGGPEPADVDYKLATGETLAQTLDLANWDTGHYLAEALLRLETEIADAKRTEDEIVKAIRSEVFHALRDRPAKPAVSGVFAASVDDIRAVQRTMLFNGLTEGCDATSLVFDVRSFSNSSIRKLPSSSTGAHFSTAPLRSRRKCHGTMLE